MPLGDADIASGVFFKDFGSPVTFGGSTVLGNFDAPGKDAVFGSARVSDIEYTVEIDSKAFNPMPRTGSRLTVAGAPYEVRSVDPIDDGAVSELRLKRVG